MKIKSAHWGLSAGFLFALLAFRCGGAKTTPSIQCLINSDCKSAALQCSQGYCVKNCVTSQDCRDGARCIIISSAGPGGAGGAGGAAAGAPTATATGTVCQAPEKMTCALNSDCSPLKCGKDLQCRNECKTAVDCNTGNVCTVSGVCVDLTSATDRKTYDPSTNDVSIPGTAGAAGGGQSGGGTSGGGGNAGAGGGSGGLPGMGGGSAIACANPQTSFGLIGQGDSNPTFQSGVGALGANVMYIFSGYTNPPGDGGPGSQEVYVQAFDPKTGANKGPSQALFSPPTLGFEGANYVAGRVDLFSAAVAPTGDIVLVYQLVNSAGSDALYVAFLSPSTPSDGGAVGLQLQHVALLNSTDFVSAAGGDHDNPRAIWSNASQTFVVNYRAVQTISIAKFSVGGQMAGGAGPVPTLNSPDYVQVNGAVGESGNLLGVAFSGGQNQIAAVGLTILDESGNLVGNPIRLGQGDNNNVWTGVAGTAQGFVCLFNQAGQAAATALFVSTSPDAGIVGASASTDGGIGTYPGFNLTGNFQDVRAISDNVGNGGKGGVGVALVTPSGGVSFAYVNADGLGHQGPSTVFPQGGGAGKMSMTNFNGSFVISTYTPATHSTQVIATGICP